mgnify:CR=1 FL=1
MGDSLSVNGIERPLTDKTVGELLATEMFSDEIRLMPAEAKLRSILFELGAIEQEEYADNGDMLLTVHLQLQDFRRALARAGIDESRFIEQEKEAWQ